MTDEQLKLADIADELEATGCLNFDDRKIAATFLRAATRPAPTEAVREALEPFAEVAKHITKQCPDNYSLIPMHNLTAKHFRDASAALAALSVGEAVSPASREQIGRAIYLAMYQHKGGRWEANDYKDAWYEMADRFLAALPSEAIGRQWHDISTAPKDGTKIWGWLYDSGIVLMHWVTAEQNAAAEGSNEPDEYISCWVKSGEPDDGDWSPKFWLPFDSVGVPPGVAWIGCRWRDTSTVTRPTRGTP